MIRIFTKLLDLAIQPIKQARRLFISRRYVRYGLLTTNILILGVVSAYALLIPSTHHKALSVTKTIGAAAVDPLDQVSSADIAVNVARMTSLPESTAITNQADSVNAQLALAPVESAVVSKPQAVTTALKSRKDIQVYVVKGGDTIASIADKFGVTSDSILWSNGLSGNSVEVGKQLVIPPVNGVVYTVQNGDTPDSLAQKYHSSRDQIIAFNDAELNGLKPGERIIIPGGQNPTPILTSRTNSYAVGFSFGSAPIYGYNGYDYGFCTWYVATQLPVPSNWGNANTWDNLAPLSGWTVSSVPHAGSVGQTDRGSFGHVAYVYAVSADGSMIKYRDMNGLAGFARVGDTVDWVPASRFEHYIYR